MNYFIGIDAGGTKTDYILGDETRELARVRSGTIKLMRTDSATAAKNLDLALRHLAEQSGISLNSITRTCVGTAGETVPMVVSWLRQEMKSRISGELLLLGDVEIALDAAFPGKPGVIVLAGTGSNVAGRAPDGTLVTGGGWGPALADQGSGHRIGLEALRAAFLAKDEGRHTRLLNDAMGFWGLATLNELIECANAIPPPDFSKLVSLVLDAARAGDVIAAEVLKREGESLAYVVTLVMRRLQVPPPHPAWVPPLTFAGSIMEKAEPVREALISAVRRQFPTVETVEGVIDPLAGAIWRARSA